MTATEVLRRLMDERGVEWDYGIRGATTTRFNANGVDLTFTPMRGGLVCSTILTPEQAIAVTLGSCNCPNDCTNGERTGTCRIKPWKMERDTGFYDCMECSECGYVTDVSEWAKATYCAGCGRRIEQ